VPSWPHLLVADSTTQWLLLLKQSAVSSVSCFLPLASSHILFFHVLNLWVHFPPHAYKLHFNYIPGCCNGFLHHDSMMSEGCRFANRDACCLHHDGRDLNASPGSWFSYDLCAPSFFPSQTARPHELWAICGVPCETGKRIPILGTLSRMYHILKQLQPRKHVCSYICADRSKRSFKASCCLRLCQLPVLSFPCKLVSRDSRRKLGFSASGEAVSDIAKLRSLSSSNRLPPVWGHQDALVELRLPCWETLT